jgi:recombinational DNA repair protein RecR
MMICEEHKLTEGQKVYPEQRCPWCERNELRAEIERILTEWNGWRHLMNVQLSTACRQRDDANLQNSELETRWKQQMEKEAIANQIMLRYEAALKKIDAMRKRLPDPDFNEQRNTASGIAEIIEAALTEKRKCQVCDARSPEICSACMGTGLEL